MQVSWYAQLFCRFYFVDVQECDVQECDVQECDVQESVVNESNKFRLHVM